MDPLCDALIEEGIITAEQLQEIKDGKRAGSVVLEILDTLSVDEEKIVSVFTNRFGIGRAVLSDILPEALEGYSEKSAFKYMSIPFDRDGGLLKVAMVDPLNFNTLQDISFLTGLSVIPYAATRGEILQAVNTCYEISSELSTVLDRIEAYDEDSIGLLNDNPHSAAEVFQTGGRMDVSGEGTLSAPAIKLVNLLFNEATGCRASDIHIEPGQKKVDVRFRIDGVLKTHMEVPKWLHSALVSRIKIMSKLDISNRKTPQDGSIKISVKGNPVDLRISTLPTHLGEKVVIRFLNPERGNLELRDGGIDDEEYGRLKRSFSQPQGMILVTGPTGSGKTTTLHGVLKELNSHETNIVTIEDPVEYELEGITQVQVNEKAGLNFANSLRSILRQDPDIVMVGEIRDKETAEIAFRASMTGHLVLSTLHTNDTASTVTRLLDIGIEPTLVASSLLSIVAQRLVRVNCKHCLEGYRPDDGVFSLVPGINSNARFVKGMGCKRCNGTGYNGRTAVFEILDISPAIKKLILNTAPESQIKMQAAQEGMKTLFEAAAEKVYQGITTIEEVLRVISIDGPGEKTCPVCNTQYTGSDCPCSESSQEDDCSACGKRLDLNWKFCPYCGKTRKPYKIPEIQSLMRVLVVDDEPGLLKMVEIALRPLTLDIYTAQNGREAIEKAFTIKPNLIITDINMPVMDGFEMIKNLRSQVNTMFIPIIILSSRDAAEDMLKGFTYGTDDYVTKPFDYPELQARVKRLLYRTYG